ncbi:MAG: TonB-dependent receptor [Bacteroidales bacterium]|nr:TonB-dependent receptor [Bacteroidales bacterium]
MKKYLMIITLFLLSAASLMAQIEIAGKVTTVSGEPVPGVNIIIKGTETGTITDIDGNYSISDVPADAVLVFSFIGMLTEEVEVGNRNEINMTLVEDILNLDEIVVIGYGTVTKRDLTGAVSSVRSDEITMAPVANTVEAIQGRVAGLDIARNDGRANSGTYILLRGNRSITRSSEPIFIIDGIQGNIDNLNPSDIVSINVLKDASSTAIYGSKGANGIFIITTKKAEKGRMQVDFNSYVSINSWPSFPSALQGDTWFRYLEEGYAATYGQASADRDALLSAWGLSPAVLNPYIDSSKWVDWIDESLQTGIQFNNTISIRGGTDKVQSSFSLGYNRTEGIYKNDYVDIITLRENLNVQAAKWAKFGIITGLIFRNSESRPSRINKAFGMVPLGDVYDENGDINQYPVEGMTDVISLLADNIEGTYKNNSKSINITANPYAEISLANGLTFKSILGTSLSANRQGIFNSDHTYMMLAGSQTAIRNATYNTGLGYSYTWENILDYSVNIANDHEILATFITSYGNSRSESSGEYSEGFLYDDFLFYNLDAGVNPSVNSYYSVKKYMSYAGRLNYNFRGKYFLTGSVRYDGVSQLSEKWDVFPAGAVAWRISDESFMKSTSNWLNNLKLRISYGVAGSDNIPPYFTLTEVTSGTDIINLGGGQVLTSVPTVAVGNVLLTWEKTYTLNIGVDFGLFRNRVDGSVDFYNADTKGIIFDRDLPFSGGGFGPKAPYKLASNIGRMKNNGIEITVNSRNIQTQAFQWSTNFTFARNWEEITSIDLGADITVDDLISLGLFMGEPLHTFYDYKKTGIWQQGEEADAAVFGLEPGDVKIESSLTKQSDGIWYKTITDDEGNDSIVEYTAVSPYTINASDDRQIIGQGTPKWTAGLQNTFTYKGFDLSIFLTARWGQMIEGQLLGYFDHGRINLPDNYDYWTETNPTNDYPRPYQRRTARYSSPVAGLSYVDASYLKIKNITMGYTIPKSLINRTGLSNFRIYGTVYNSLILTKSHLLKGIDPETGASDSFPLYKQLVFGVNVSF